MADGTFLTALRTGAASAVASSVLADPHSRTVGLIGCGAQAVTQLHALSRLFPIERVCLFDTDASVSRGFPGSNPRGWTGSHRLRVCRSPPGRRRGRHPVHPDLGRDRRRAGDRGRGSQAVTAHQRRRLGLPQKIELPHSILQRAFVCADFPEQALREGECQQLSQSRSAPVWWSWSNGRTSTRGSATGSRFRLDRMGARGSCGVWRPASSRRGAGRRHAHGARRFLERSV